MVGLAAALSAIGLADVIGGGLSGHPSSRRRVGLGFGVAAILMVGYAYAVQPSTHAVIYSLGTTAGVLSWLLLRLGEPSERRAGYAAAFFCAFVSALLLGAPSGDNESIARLGPLLASSPSPLLAATPAPEIAVGVGLLLVLASSANGFVRVVLRASGTRLVSSEATLRGGRLIGIIERWLIFALAVVGAPTAAAIVVSAKSLVRFPELADTRGRAPDADQAGAREIDYVTEYFLLGSLLSWGCAIVAVLVLSDWPT